jgi:hypothetical protein
MIFRFVILNREDRNVSGSPVVNGADFHAGGSGSKPETEGKYN